jgi:hypothetical protein
MIPTAGDHLLRRQTLLAKGTLNGIDYIEIAPGTERPKLLVYFLLALPAGVYGLMQPPYDRIRITGGVRIRSFKVKSVTQETGRSLAIELDQWGDLSPYTLWLEHPGIDPVLGHQDFTFRPAPESFFDTAGGGGSGPGGAPGASEQAPAGEAPLIDYRAKDYTAFRTALADFARARVPGWDDHPADLGTTLMELLAYAGDHLSYYQDAVMNEAWLATARQRESVRRHALLIDYRMHDGCAARTFVHVRIGPRPAAGGALPPPRSERAPVSGVVPEGTEFCTAPDGSGGGETCFSAMARTRLHEDLNELTLYDWGSRNSTLLPGATGFDLAGAQPLQSGDWLLVEEVKGPRTGRPSEADPARRQVVRVAQVQATADPLTGQAVTRVVLDGADALQHEFIIAAEGEDGQPLTGITAVRGNLVPAEHGRLVTETLPAVQRTENVLRVRLGEGPVTQRSPFDLRSPAAALLSPDPRQAAPRVEVTVIPPRGAARTWRPVPDLLSAGAFAEVFVAEIGFDGSATLRFGDGFQGRRPTPGSVLAVAYWAGSGTAGNIGAEALVAMGPNPERDPAALGDGWPFAVQAVRNPLPTLGGVDPEPMEQVQRLAPAAMLDEQRRSVTPADYAAAAETHPAVARAMASFRWTGSWHTVDLVVDPRNRAGLTPALRESIAAHVESLQLSGYDLQVSEPLYLPLEIAVEVETAPGHRRLDVQEAVREALSNRDLPGGRQGFFHPDRFTFGQPVYLSHLIAAVEAVAGVQSVRVTTFKPYAHAAGAERTSGFIPVAPTAIARCDNDPNYPENGLVRLTLRGGL